MRARDVQRGGVSDHKGMPNHGDLAAAREGRSTVLGDRKPASTLIVGGLANPAWKIEIEGREGVRGHCHTASGLRLVWRLDIQSGAENQL